MQVDFDGFAGIRLIGDAIGQPSDPAILLLHDIAQTRRAWRNAADALVRTGRYVLNMDLRGHGDSEWPLDGQYNIDAFSNDLRALLAQMSRRPVIIAHGVTGWLVLRALAADAHKLAGGLVLVDPASSFSADIDGICDPRIAGALDLTSAIGILSRNASGFGIPVSIISGDKIERDVHRVHDGLATATVDGPADHNIALESHVPNLTSLIDGIQANLACVYRLGGSTRTLRDMMGCFATGVTVVTAMAPNGEPIGFTANSFTSVSLDPPLLLVCIVKDAQRAQSYTSAGHFAVNILQADQQLVSSHFAMKKDDKFTDVAWRRGEYGNPIICDSLGHFECETFNIVEAGDHYILIGRILNASFESWRDPLIYYRGKYRALDFK
ncbi:hypothetical protein CHU95_12915 [Niveispirillum lacus]|uniref:Flavin reductase like domain-containing protein n=1 Tax=Niveispirillum lacus TaxID=1981099 RepID=A0A255YYK6_9PROT|nr:alpha/beta fold hydrolase [Niveispirillum lacus]OYQ34327.1 hypothetical protein CHU95_12915 [Niveispirillum lacus]